MKKTLTFVLSIISILLIYNYFNLKKENDLLYLKIENFEKELDNLKNGPSALLNQVKSNIKLKNYNDALNIINKIKTTFSNSKEAIEAINLNNEILLLIEEEKYNSVINTDDIYDLENFKNEYPDNKNILIIEKKLQTLYYQNALKNNTVYDYELFLEKFPNSSNSQQIEKLKEKQKKTELLQLAENKLPDLKQIIDEYYYDEYIEYTSSSVTVLNETSSDLTIYFIGVKIIESSIPINEKRTINLENGNYDIVLEKGDYEKSYYHLNKNIKGNYQAYYTDYKNEKKNENSYNYKQAKTNNDNNNANYFKSKNSTHIQKVRIGAKCNDGSESSATGKGACSHHGGVRYWIYE